MALEYGVSLVASRWHVDQLLGNIKAHVTFQIEAFGVSRRKIIEFSAADVLKLAQEIVAWASEQGKALSIPIGPEFGEPTEAYTPLHSGTKAVTPVLADQTDVGMEVPPYEYVEIIPPIG